MESSYQDVILTTAITPVATSTPADAGWCSETCSTLWALTLRGYAGLGYQLPKVPNADVVNDTVGKIREMGPYTEYKKAAKFLEEEKIIHE